MTDWNQAQSILCVRLDSIGDVLMTTPALRALKETDGSRRITLLTSSAGAEAAALVPEIDEVLVYEAPWMKATPPRADGRAETAMAAFLKELGFDAAVIFTVYSQNPAPAAFLCYLAGIPRRLAHCHENIYQLLTDWVRDPEPQGGIRHEVERQLDLVASVGATTMDRSLSLAVPDGARARVDARLQAQGLDRSRPLVVVHPGATAASRRYAPESFSESVRRLWEETGCQIVLSGSAAEAELARQIRQRSETPALSLAGLLDFPELCALIAAADLLISNNTGPAHVAAAVGTPVVDLYALTNPQHTPWTEASRVLYNDVPCKYCYKSVCPEGHHRCLQSVTPVEVVRAARELLESEEPSPIMNGMNGRNLCLP